jgi:hypothetical protein
MQLFASKAPVYEHASPEIFATYNRGVQNLQRSQAQMYQTLFPLLPACRKRIQRRWTATSNVLDRTAEAWNVQVTEGGREEADEVEEQEQE